MKWLVVLTALGAALPSYAFDSACRQYSDPTLEVAQLGEPSPCVPEEGPNIARQRWVGPLDEHRQLFERALRKAGLPHSFSQTLKLRIFTSAEPVQVGNRTLASLKPVAFQDAVRAQTRAFSLGELSQLPDWSYALWDWATGHETCPLDPGTFAGDCHAFSTHMGPVNANHFVPLSQHFYARYLALALARAASCKAMHVQLGTDAARFLSFKLACEQESLALEAVAQHYLQDAFSTGHPTECSVRQQVPAGVLCRSGPPVARQPCASCHRASARAGPRPSLPPRARSRSLRSDPTQRPRRAQGQRPRQLARPSGQIRGLRGVPRALGSPCAAGIRPFRVRCQPAAPVREAVCGTGAPLPGGNYSGGRRSGVVRLLIARKRQGAEVVGNRARAVASSPLHDTEAKAAHLPQCDFSPLLLAAPHGNPGLLERAAA